MKILFEAHELLSSSKTGVGYYQKVLLDTLNELQGSECVELATFKDSEIPSGAQTQNRSGISRKITLKLQSYGIRLPASWLWPGDYSTYLFPDFFIAPVPTSKKSVVVVHDLAFLLTPEYLPSRNFVYRLLWPDLRTYLQRSVRYSVNHASYVLTTSETVKQEIMESYDVPANRVMVSGIPPESSFVPGKSTVASRIPTSKYIYFQATLEPRKNHIGILRAYSLLPDDLRNTYSLVLGGGKGWKNKDIQACIDTMSKEGLHVIQLGYVSDKEKLALYQNASLYVQPSHYEGFGMPLLEAMACGVPVACSDIPIFREVCGSGAAYYNRKNPAAIALLIEKVLKDNTYKKMLIREGFKRVSHYRKDTSELKSLLRTLKSSEDTS